MPVEILTPVLSAIGGAIGTLGLYSIIPKTIINRITENHRQDNRILLEDLKTNNQIAIEKIKADNTLTLEKLKNNYQKEVEVYKTGLLSVARYSEYQFKLYNELWVGLYELKCKAEDLWEHASSKNLSKFAEQLKLTKRKIEQNILLIKEEHYQDLIRILETFEKYKVGKVNLINLRNSQRRERDIDNIGVDEINFININEEVKNEYIFLVELIAADLKKHLSEPV